MSDDAPSSNPASLPSEAPATITALPDIQSTPSSSKKPKLLHVDPSSESAQAGPSTQPANPSADANGNGENMDVDGVEKTPVFEAIPLPEEVSVKEEFYELRMGWSGKIYELRVGGNDMVYDFRHQIEVLTNVPPERQKLIGLSKGKLSSEMDSVRFGALGVKNGIKFTMIGTPEADSFVYRSETAKQQQADDFDVRYKALAIAKGEAVRLVAPADDPRNKRKIQEVIRSCPITVMDDPRPGKRLLVLDLDYTIVDTKPLLEGSLPADECARPGLHDFLEKVYPHYDIVVWSQTHWRWLESKLVEIGMIGGDRNYKISFVADRTSMFPVFTQRDGQPFKHEVKPLAYFWASFPHWSAKNSIHIDDLSRNFALNPGEGLKIRAFKGAGTPDGLGDKELIKLGNYLIGLAERCEDFTSVDHSNWKKILRHPPAQPAASASASGPAPPDPAAPAPPAPPAP